MKIATQLRLHYAEIVQINCITKNNDDLVQFFEKGFPLKAKYFNLNIRACDFPKVQFYYPSLKNCLLRVTKEIYIFYIHLTTEIFEGIVNHSCCTERLIINECLIDAQRPLSFANQIYNTFCIGFENIKSRDMNSSSFLETLLNILSAISECSLKDSLNRLNIYNCGIPINEVRDQTEKLCLSKTELTQDKIFLHDNY